MATRGVNEQVLDSDKQRVIRLQAALVREGQFFLAGGTALGLRIGHRFSDDLDWFTPNRFDAKELLASLGHLTEKPTKTQPDGRHTVRAYYGTLETSFISYEQVPAHPEQISVGGTKIPVADIEILAAMKAAALHDRGAKRDFIDMHAIAGLSGWSVGRFIEHGARMLGTQAHGSLPFPAADCDRPPVAARRWATRAATETSLARRHHGVSVHATRIDRTTSCAGTPAKGSSHPVPRRARARLRREITDRTCWQSSRRHPGPEA